MNGSNRRIFMLQLAAGGSALLAASVHAQTPPPPMVTDRDATAAALGYTVDATKVDIKKYPKYARGQRCGNCQLYTGKVGEPAGACGIFPGKLVSANAWCSAYAQKA
ncbi:high-potential iron-sulfur protein [Hydrogenophaga sp.]|uniref:high-potential iron-sulfur protein n=1 Tax=Hydrogenophaga sp. TaxID=1904254 RepID=UPI003F707D9F